MAIRKIILIIFISFLASCSTPNWYKPAGYRLFRQMPEGSPGLRLGWRHGCESGLGTQFGGKVYMTFYEWQRDPDITSVKPDVEKIRKRYPKLLKDINWDDPNEVKKNFNDYNIIFWTAHAFCRHSTIGTLQQAQMVPVLVNENRYKLDGVGVGNVWKIDGKGDTRLGRGYW